MLRLLRDENFRDENFRDENFRGDISRGLKRRRPDLDIVRVCQNMSVSRCGENVLKLAPAGSVTTEVWSEGHQVAAAINVSQIFQMH